jgi:hypothetical protein
MTRCCTVLLALLAIPFAWQVFMITMLQERLHTTEQMLHLNTELLLDIKANTATMAMRMEAYEEQIAELTKRVKPPKMDNRTGKELIVYKPAKNSTGKALAVHQPPQSFTTYELLGIALLSLFSAYIGGRVHPSRLSVVF